MSNQRTSQSHLQQSSQEFKKQRLCIQITSSNLLFELAHLLWERTISSKNLY